MKARTRLAMLATALMASGCTTTQNLRAITGESAHGTVVQGTTGRPVITAIIDGTAYTAPAGPTIKDVQGQYAERLGWKPDRKIPHVRPGQKIYYGSTTLLSNAGQRLPCEHLNQGNDWRLNCLTDDGREVRLDRVKTYGWFPN